MIGVEIEAPPLERRLRGALKELSCGVAEELRDVDAIDLTLLLLGRHASPGRPVAEEVREEAVEEASSPASHASSHPLLCEVDLAEVLDLFGAVRKATDSLCYRRSAVTRANRLLNRHLWFLPLALERKPLLA
jgi:hypothetical protein